MTMPKENQMFSLMLCAARQRLIHRTPEEIAQKANIEYDREKQAFHLQSLAENVEIQYPSFDIFPELGAWHQLLILHYLDLADGAAMEENLISFSQVKNGMIRGGGFDRDCETAIQKMMQWLPEQELER